MFDFQMLLHDEHSTVTTEPLEKPERRFCVHLANEMDLFITAQLSGDEPDFHDCIGKRLSERHDGKLDHVEIVRVILVG